MTLSDTANIMESDSYKERFIAEYVQLAVRVERLNRLMVAASENALPTCLHLTCPLEVLASQLDAMKVYLRILKARADIEEIDLPNIEEG